LINLTILIVTSVYLLGEAVERLFSEHTVNGRIMILAAAVALLVNLATVALLHALSRGNMNIRAAYLHNLADSFSSFGVLLAGLAIVYFGATWVDTAMTILVSSYVLKQSVPDIRRSIHILMEGAPADVNTEELVDAMRSVSGVSEVHHLHVWELDEHERALEAHIVVEDPHIERWSEIKQEIKARLDARFHIHHSTLELESRDETACRPCPPGNQHC
jgi:cobalt-zinc-cadmium efflux system protein